MELVNHERYTRFPVYENDMDNVIGFLHAKDLIQYLDNKKQSHFNLTEIIREPYSVVETQSLNVIFKDMQRNNMHVAIVLDEYGGTEGLITIEDIIEEIVGDILSEHARSDMLEEKIKEINKNEYLIDGTIHLHEIESPLSIRLPTDEFDTLSGFLIDQFNYLPGEGERPYVYYDNIRFEVSEVTDKRIEKVIAVIEKDTPN